VEWNIVFLGCQGAPASHCTDQGGGPYSTVASTPIIAEKPYINIDTAGKFYLRIPPVETNKVGPTTNFANGLQVDFADVYVATDKDSAATINGKLSSGLHVVLSPGIYNLTDSISITRGNTVLLGIGFPTLVASSGKPAVVVGNVDGVRVGGILFEAGRTATTSLIQWGNPGYAGSAANPGVFYDAFARCGGTNDQNEYQVQVDTMALINSGNVILDNTWFWRADHGIGGSVADSDNPNNHGIVVNGDNVHAYGLASEHQLQDLTQWNGNNGQTYFYQSELPYDVTQANYGDKNYVGFRVGSSVTSHKGWGVAVYCFFRDNVVNVTNAIVTPSSGSTFVNSLTVFLNGKGEIQHVINNQGNPVNTPAQLAYVCNEGK